MNYEEADKSALRRALIALGRCPKCRRLLRPAHSAPETLLACVSCDEVYEYEGRS